MAFSKYSFLFYFFTFFFFYKKPINCVTRNKMALNEGLCPVNHNNIIQGKILFWFQILNEQCKICIFFCC